MAKLLTGTRIYGTGTVDTQLLINGGVAASSTATGSLRVFGGAGVSGDMYVGGTIYGNISGTISGVASTATNLQAGTAGQVPYQTGPGATSFFGPGSAGQLLVSSGAAAPSYTSTGSIYVGRANFADDIVGGSAGSLPYQDSASSTIFLGIGSAGQILLSTGTAPSWVNTSTLVVGNAANVGLTNDAASTSPHFVTFVSTTTGYTNMKGAGMSGITYVPSTGNFGLGINTPIYRLDVAGGARFTGITTVTNTTAATSADTGALQVDGGIGVNGAGWFGGSLYAGSASANYLEIDGNATGTGPNLVAVGSDASIDILYSAKGTAGAHAFRTNGTTRQFQISHTASAVNYVQLTGGATGSSPTLSLQGTDGDVGLTITPKNLGKVIVSSTASASSTATGALVVTGGVGINQNLYVGGNGVISGDLAVNGGDITTTAGTFNLINATATTINFGGNGTAITVGSTTGTTTVRTVLAVTSPYNSTASTNGALAVTGGVGIGGDLRVGGTIYGTVSVSGSITTATNLTGGTAGQVPYQTGPGVTSYFGPGTSGDVLVSNGTSAPTYNNVLTLAGTTAATSTSTGALQVRGGVGIGGRLYADGVSIITSNADGNSTPVPLDVQGAWIRIGDPTTSFASPSGVGIKLHDSGAAHYSLAVTGTNFVISNTGANGNQLLPAGRTDIITMSSTGIVTINNNTNASSQTTGALVVTGGIGAQGDIYAAGAVIDAVRIGVAATNEIDTTSGNLVLDSAGGTVQVDDNLTVTGNLTVQGVTTTVDSTVTNVADPIITIGGGANGSAPTVNDNKDRGIAFQWHNGVNARTGFFGYDASTGYFTFLTSATITNEVTAAAGGTTRGAIDANLAGGTAMSIPYQSAANTTAFLAAGTAGYVLSTNGTGSAPTWINAGGLTAGTASQIKTVGATASAAYYLTFVDSNNAASADEYLYTTSTVAVNPATGVVGVGTTSPTYRLHVASSSSSAGHLFGVSKPSATSLGDWSAMQMAYTGSWSNNLNGTALITVTDSITDSGTSNTVGAFGVGFDGTGYFAIKNLYNSGYSASGTVMKVNPTNTYFSTNVGIGAATAGAKLHIDGGSAVPVRIVSSGYSGIEYHNTNGTAALYIGTESGSSAARYNAIGSIHKWYNNSAQAMHLNATGLGIGIDPVSGYKLTVGGPAFVSDTTAATSTITGALRVSGGAGIGGELYLGGSLVQTPAALGTTLGNSVLYQSLRGSNSNSSYLDTTMIRDSAGTDWTTAGTRIQQKIDSTWMAYQQFNGTNVNGGIEWGSGTTTTSPQAISPRMRLNSSGVLSILTTTAASSTTTGALVVAGGVGIGGNLYVGGTLTAGSVSGTTTNATNVTITNETSSASTHYLTFVSATSGNTGVKVDGSELVFQPSTGNLSIGTTTVNYKLTVVGTSNLPKILIDRSNNAASGINWYSNTYDTWATYMAAGTATSVGPRGTLTAPSGSLVTSWALRNYVENSAGYGWTFESGAGSNTTTPTVVAEIRSSDGSAKFNGTLYLGSYFQAGTNVTAGYYQDATNGAYRSITTGNTGYYFQNNGGGSTSMYVGLSGTYAGRVAIGGASLTTPQYALDVNNNTTGANSIQASFGTSMAAGYWSGIHFGYSETSNSSYRKSALVFERQDGSARGKIHILNNGSGDSSSATLSDAKVTILYTGNVGIGTTNPGYTLEVNGSFAATTKSFLIDHPTKPGMKLRYGSLEGPENGVYVRGRLTGKGVIELPDYWTGLVDPDSITVTLTPVGKHQPLYVKDIKDNKVYVGGGRKVDCFYTVWGERKDVEKLVVEIE